MYVSCNARFASSTMPVNTPVASNVYTVESGSVRVHVGPAVSTIFADEPSGAP